MKKLIFALIALITLSCSQENLQSESLENSETLAKGKPQKADCDAFVEPPQEARELIVNDFNTRVEVAYTVYKKRKVVSIYNLTWSATQAEGNYQYGETIYRFEVRDSNGEVVDNHCTKAVPYITEYTPPKKLPNGTYQIEFTDFPEIEKEFYFTIGNTQARKGKQKGKNSSRTSALPDGVDRQLIIDALNEPYESPNSVVVRYRDLHSDITFGYLPFDCYEGWYGDNGVVDCPYSQVVYNFNISDSAGTVTQGSVLPGNYVAYYSVNLTAGVYDVTFSDFPEVTREYKIEVL